MHGSINIKCKNTLPGKREIFFSLVRKWVFDKIAGGVQKLVLGLLPWGKAAGV